LVLTASTAPLRRQADTNPAITPITIASTVPTVTMPIVLPSLPASSPVTGWLSANDTPMFPWNTSWFR
jgi:hypothetical protein